MPLDFIENGVPRFPAGLQRRSWPDSFEWIMVGVKIPSLAHGHSGDMFSASSRDHTDIQHSLLSHRSRWLSQSGSYNERFLPGYWIPLGTWCLVGFFVKPSFGADASSGNSSQNVELLSGTLRR